MKIYTTKLIKVSVASVLLSLLLGYASGQTDQKNTDSIDQLKLNVVSSENSQDTSDFAIGEIPAIFSYQDKTDTILFLSDTRLKENTSEQTTTTLQSGMPTSEHTIGNVMGKNIVYQNQADIAPLSKSVNQQINEESREYFVTYNKDKKSFGIFSGYLDLELVSENYLGGILNDHNVTPVRSIKVYARVKVKDLNNTLQIKDELENDSRVKSVSIRIREGKISKY